jgi:putative transcriptional regulator
VIRFRLKELIADRAFKEDRVITMAEVADGAGVHRATLSKIANERGYSTSTEIIDRLCTYFGVGVADLMEHVD